MLKDWIKALGNKVEELEFSVQSKDKIIEQLEAENRRLKGLPAKPQFADKTTELEGKESDDKDKDKKPNPGKGHPRRKKHDLAIDLTKQCEVNPDDLDSTYDYKGTRKVIVQDILFQRNNICFELESKSSTWQAILSRICRFHSEVFTWSKNLSLLMDRMNDIFKVIPRVHFTKLARLHQ